MRFCRIPLIFLSLLLVAHLAVADTLIVCGAGRSSALVPGRNELVCQSHDGNAKIVPLVDRGTLSYIGTDGVTSGFCPKEGTQAFIGGAPMLVVPPAHSSSDTLRVVRERPGGTHLIVIGLPLIGLGTLLVAAPKQKIRGDILMVNESATAMVLTGLVLIGVGLAMTAVGIDRELSR